MNANCDLLTPAFAPEATFEVRACSAISRALEDSQLEKLKARLLRETLNDAAITCADGLIRHAANDAAALAWDTHFPLLMFPTLFEEKVLVVLAQVRRQASVRRRSLELLPA